MDMSANVTYVYHVSEDAYKAYTTADLYIHKAYIYMPTRTTRSVCVYMEAESNLKSYQLHNQSKCSATNQKVVELGNWSLMVGWWFVSWKASAPHRIDEGS